MASAAEPTFEAISDVVAKTGCRERQAKLYLKKSGNDVAAAVGLYQSHYSVKSPANTSILTLPYSVHTSSPPSTSEFSEAPTSLDPRSDDEQQNDGTPDSESEGELQPPDSSKWDFILPNVPAAPHFQPGGSDGSAQFSMLDLIGAVQHGATFDQVAAYLGHHSHPNANIVRSKINNPVHGLSPMFYVVARNDERIIRLFVKYGCNVNAIYGSPPLPLLAFAIINSKSAECETTSSVAMLLSLGADSSVIPKAFYSPFCQDLPESGPSEEDLDDLEDPDRSWCQSTNMRTTLAETLNLTQRYHLEKSSKLENPTDRQRQVARRSNSEDLFGIPYFMVGQSAATDSLTKNFLHHMLRRQRDPLVLVFAGPSGHGKTELARRLGFLLSLDLHISDCTIVSRETELFGPRKPFVGAEEGSPLNNFLARKNGEKSILFLDEFEKATPDIWNALLIPFDKGEYQDRRNLRTIDCSKTIWIIATNALDEKIEDFCKKNPQIFDEDNQEEREVLLEGLNEVMKEEFKGQFKPPLTGRVSAFIPFMPFSFSETCIGVHKCLLELATEVRRPVNTTKGDYEQLLGNIRLKIRLDASVCQVLAKGYDTQLGIRSLRKIVRDTVAKKLDYEYMLTHDLISEGGPMEDYVVFVSNGKLRVARVPAKAADVQAES